MNELRLKYPVRMMRRIMNVSASGYYAWVDRPLSKRAQEEVRLELEIMAAHQRNRQTYGPERLQRDLAEHGVRVGVCRIRLIRQKLGIRCKQKRRFKTTTNSAHRLPVADNLLGQQFKVSQPNAVWVSDITYIPTDEGWLYLAGHKDLFTGELVGYAMGERMTRNLVSQSLFRALRAKRPARGLMHHSDRGSQYCSQEYRNLMERSGLRSSMSGKGNCFDNAPMESFWGTLKQELVHHRHYRSRQEAIRDITEYIEIFYNSSAARPGWDSCHLRPFNKDSMQDYSQLERFGVHYCHPTPLSPFYARDVVLQAGGFGEHRFNSASYTVRTSEYPGAIGSYAAPEAGMKTHKVPIQDKHLHVHLPPATEISLDLEMDRFVNRPSYALPWYNGS